MNDIKQNIESDAFWVRTLFTVGFFLVYGLLDVVIIFLMLVQWGFTLVTGQVNPALNQFSAGLALYIAQIVKYVTGNSELKPFPFTDWPTPKSDMPTEQ
jgi:hypothetical protein